MKKLKFLFAALTVGLFMTGCGTDDETIIDPTPTENSAEVFAAAFDAEGNTVVDPGFSGITPSNDLGTTAAPAVSFFDATTFKGAVNPSGTAWYTGWSSYENILAGGNTTAFNTQIKETWTDQMMQDAGNVVEWTADKTYVLDGFVFVNSGQTLNIEAGTVIQGMTGEAENASALIVARGATINANGTADAPIIMTYDGDNGGAMPTLRGQWGGLIILGNASLNSAPGETAIEGIPTNESRGLYGGTDDADNSGTLRYISIRHGGTNIGADNEINGLTLGGVGSGTTLEYIEVVANKDDGIEWFGGTVNGKHLISAFCGDDALDYDEGYRGYNQYVVVHQDPALQAADRGGEHDGGTDPETATPYATPWFYNVTSVGNEGSRAITFRDNAGGYYVNSIFVNYAKGIDIEDLDGQNEDSYQQFVDGNLAIRNCVFFNIGAGTTAADLFTVNIPE